MSKSYWEMHAECPACGEDSMLVCVTTHDTYWTQGSTDDAGGGWQCEHFVEVDGEYIVFAVDGITHRVKWSEHEHEPPGADERDDDE